MLRVFLELLDILQFSSICSDCSDTVKLSNKGVGTKEEKLKRSVECNAQWVLPSKDSAALDPHAVFPFSFSPSFQIAIYRSTPHLSPCLPPGRFHWQKPGITKGARRKWKMAGKDEWLRKWWMLSTLQLRVTRVLFLLEFPWVNLN